VPRRSLRLKVAGRVLAVESDHPTAALDPPLAFAPFLSARGGDIRLAFTREPAPEPRGELLFDSGSVWRVHRHGRGLLYTFRVPRLRPPVYKAVLVDRGLRRGRLFFPPVAGGPRYALDYPLDELLFQHRLAREGALEVHACGVAWQGRTLLFCGQSGAGKSTTARLWQRHVPAVRVLSDDRIVLEPASGRPRAWGTPWHGEGRFAAPAHAPLGALFFLRHGRVTEARPLPRPEAAARLFARGFPPPWDAGALARVLRACATVTARVPAFDLAFRPDRSAVEAARAAVGSMRRA
jgi:hypothetical protein